MRLRRLIIEVDEESQWVTLHKEGASEDRRSDLPLDRAFTIDDVVAAACATGTVVEREGECWIVNSVECDALAAWVDEMLSYFHGSGEPREELLRIKDHVDRYWESAEESRPPLSLWAYAYLDLMVREGLVEEARNADRVWAESTLILHPERHCQQRVEELAGRYARLSQAVQESEAHGKMAPSHRGRRRGSIGDVEAG